MIPEIIEINGKQYKKYCDKFFKIRKIGTNEVYDEAIDPIGVERDYELTEQPKEEANETGI